MYYKLTPITENPEKAGWYITVDKDGDFVRTNFTDRGEWMQRHLTATHYLKPVEGVLMDEAELHRLWVAARNYEVENRFGKVPNKHPDFNEYIKRFKQ